jgi:3-phosphoinositide dependent protein kinase-1
MLAEQNAHANSDHRDVPDSRPPLRRQLKDFILGKKLGTGSYGRVVRVTDATTDSEYAMKVVVKSEIMRMKMVDAVKQERNALVRTSHPNVVKLFYAFQDKSSFYFIQELAPNGTLATLLANTAPVKSEAAKVLIGQLVLAIAHIHSRRIVHRDIKPANLLFDSQNRLKLCDFGSCRIYGDNEEMIQPTKTNFVGTPDTIAPEMLKSNCCCFASDLWALGCVVYWVLVGQAPFRAESRFRVFERIRENQFEIPETVCDSGRDLIRKLLVLEPAERLGWNDYQTGYEAIRRHPFFEGLNWEELSTTPINLQSPAENSERLELQSGIGDRTNSEESLGIASKLECGGLRQESTERAIPRAS